MRKILAVAVLVVLSASLAQASNISAKLLATQDGTDKTLWHVAVQVQSEGTNSDAAHGGGVAGMQFDITSLGAGKATPLPNGASGANLNRVKTTWALGAGDFGVLRVADKANALPAANQLGANFAQFYADDGDLDAMGGSFADSNGSQSNVTIGLGAFQTIATQDWSIPVGTIDTLNLMVVAPTYYDLTASATNGFGNYTTTNNGATTPVSIQIGAVPEPATLALMSFGVVGLIAVARRRRS